MKVKKGYITAFGEIMLRLSPSEQKKPLIAVHTLNMDFAGAESTVTVNLSFWNTPSKFVTVLPDNDLGHAARNSIRNYGVDTHSIRFDKGRIGTYYIEYGASIRSSKVLYDRAKSAIAESVTDDFNWTTILKETRFFFTSGITPALSANCAESCLLALKTAKNLGVTTCLDLNYRRSLWSAEDAKKVFNSYLPFVDVLIGNQGAAFDVFGIRSTLSNALETEHAANVAQQLMGLSDTVQQVAMTIRDQKSASENGWSGILWDGRTCFTSKKLTIEIVERLGGGDAFAAGILHGMYHHWSSEKTLDFAVSASAIKHTVPGDLCLVSASDILEVANGNTSGYVKR